MWEWKCDSPKNAKRLHNSFKLRKFISVVRKNSVHLQYEKGSEENLIIEIIDKDTFVDVHKATSTHDGIKISDERKVYYKRVR